MYNRVHKVKKQTNLKGPNIMAKQLSERAQVAKLIRSDLKANGVKAKVRASGGSMSDKVEITLIDCAPWTVKAVKQGVAKYQLGTFDGMTDMYVTDNNRDDLPQVNYIFVSVEHNDEIRQQALDAICTYHGLEAMRLEDAPAILPIKPYTGFADCYRDAAIRNVLANDLMPFFDMPADFWKKPVKVIPGVAA